MCTQLCHRAASILVLVLHLTASAAPATDLRGGDEQPLLLPSVTDRHNTEQFDKHPLLAVLNQIRDIGPVSPCLKVDHTLPRHPPLRNKKYLFAADLLNSAKLVPQIITQLTPVLLTFKRENVFVSIYESGSYDSTRGWLQLYEKILNSLNIPNKVVVDGFQKTNEDRIEYLAKVRNLALEPILPHGNGSAPQFQADYVFFFNDVAFCAQDLLRLLQHHKTDLACGLDMWNWAGTDLPSYIDPASVPVPAPMPPLPHGLRRYLLNGWQRTFAPGGEASRPLQFYDNWVAHDLDGHRFAVEYPYASLEAHRQRSTRGVPFPVQCCWNGMAVMRARPFLDGLRFRPHTHGECYQSECSNLCDDFWRLGFTKVLVDPSVRVTYCPSMYPYLHTTGRPTSTWQEAAAEPVDWSTVKAPQLNDCCEGSTWDDCRHHFPWLETNFTDLAKRSGYAYSPVCYKNRSGDRCGRSQRRQLR